MAEDRNVPVRAVADLKDYLRALGAAAVAPPKFGKDGGAASG